MSPVVDAPPEVEKAWLADQSWPQLLPAVDLDLLIQKTYRVISRFASSELHRQDVLGTLYTPTDERDMDAVCKVASAFRDFAQGVALLSGVLIPSEPANAPTPQES